MTAVGRLPLSIVIVSYNMAREIPRTIRSFSPAMQQAIDAADYELILVDNGSSEPFDEVAVRALCPNLTIVHVGSNATPSPVPAIQAGLEMARGDLVGVCIDGARMASPGLLALAMTARRLHHRPIIGTIAFHLGPKVQMESVREGYNQALEDQLLTQIGWEASGYSLFDISSLAGSSSGGWFETPAETNALFLTAEHWRALGGYESRFVSPGGGLANLDMWRRACADLGGELIMLLGEATFHQVHGGIATNASVSPWDQFHSEYVSIRNCAYERPTRVALFVGRLPQNTRRFLGVGVAPRC